MRHGHVFLEITVGPSLDVVRVDNEDQALRVLEVMAPQRADAVLAADVPNVQVESFVLDPLGVEADRRDRRNMFAKLQFVEDSRLPRSVETKHQAARFPLAEPPHPEVAEG
jgi:hypothetical protein